VIKLIDVYSGNDRTDFQQLVSEGYTGIIFKAGQGGWADVPRYKPDWYREAGEAGLLRGWYWLVDSRITLQNHKNELRNWLDPQTLNNELGFWVDVEKPQISMTDRDYWKTPYAGAQHVMNFCGFLTGLGVRPGIYTGPGAYQTVAGGADQATHEYLAQFPLWTAQYPYVYIPYISKPTMYGAWTKWTFWQYREGPDINIFNGSDEEFSELFGDNIPPIIEPGEDMATYVSHTDIMSLREFHADHVRGTKVGTIAKDKVVVGDEIFTYFVAFDYAQVGDQWFHITQIDDSLVNLWVAVIHQGRTYGEVSGFTQPPVEPGVLPDIPIKFEAGDDISYYKQTVTMTLKPVK